MLFGDGVGDLLVVVGRALNCGGELFHRSIGGELLPPGCESPARAAADTTSRTCCDIISQKSGESGGSRASSATRGAGGDLGGGGAKGFCEGFFKGRLPAPHEPPAQPAWDPPSWDP